MARRKEVFKSKVLQRLFPAAPQYEPSTPPVENPSRTTSMKRKATGQATTSSGRTLTAEGPGRRVYTVLPPPADYQADSERSSTLLQRESTSDKNTAGESRDDADKDSEQDGEKEQTSRRRKRRKKKPALRPDCEKDEADPASQPSAAPGQAHGGVSKNKKRKLKKKRRKEQLLSMGLVPKAAAVEFTYSEDGESGSGVAEVSDFLRSTLKLYMSDASLSVDQRRLRSGALEDLLSSIARGGQPTLVLKQLCTLQTCVQQRETDKLEAALKELHSTQSLSEGETAAVSALFRYWITDVLPKHGGEEAELSEAHPGDRQSR